ncbi:FliI/YscN family ATPase [bacterium]|nr:MAG: FliI/YscN family ATPase [bacterium]
MTPRARGRITAAGVGAYEAELPAATVGSGVEVAAAAGRREGIVTAVRGNIARIAPLDAAEGVRVGDGVTMAGYPASVALGMAALGRTVDARGVPIDGGPEIVGRWLVLEGPAPAPLLRDAAPRPCWTGVRAIDGLATLARGQRIGVFGGAGVGKSTLLQGIVRHARADALVVALIGERGREVAGWLDALGAARARTTVVCATADQPPALRARAPLAAMAQAEYLRRRGLHVVLIVDSLARYCAALREMAAANGETTASRGYPPSAFAALGRLLERAGCEGAGAVTAVCSVLVEGDDDREPVADAARALLDGHLILSRRVAQAGRFPALDLLASCSRLFGDVAQSGHAADAAAVRRALAALEASRDLRAVGAYRPGSDPFHDAAIAAEEAINVFLSQGGEASSPDETLAWLAQLAAGLCRIEEGVS